MPRQPNLQDLIQAVIQTESSGRSNARGKAGELGLMQIQPSTAARYGVKDPRALLDPNVNKAVGTRILQDLLKKYNGNVNMALAAYNAGPAAVDKGKIPTSTQGYIRKVIGALDNALGPASADAAEFAPVKDKEQAKRMGAMGGIGMAPMVGGVDEVPLMLRQALNEGRLSSEAATALNKAARAGLLNPDHVTEILKLNAPEASAAGTAMRPGFFEDEGAGSQAMKLAGQGAGIAGVAKKLAPVGNEISQGIAGSALGNLLQRLPLEGTANAAEPPGNVEEVPSTYRRPDGTLPIPAGASVGKPARSTVPIPAGASIGIPPKKAAPSAPSLPLGVRIADWAPLVGQMGGEIAGGALGGGPEDIPAVGLGGGIGEGIGEELQTGARYLAGQPYKSQSQIAKDAGISGAVSGAGVPINKYLVSPIAHALAPSTLKAAIAGKRAFLESRAALDSVLRKVNELVGLDARAAAVAAASPIESREARAAYFAGKNLSFDQASQVYQDIGKSYMGRMTPNASSKAFNDFSNQYGARSLPLLDNGIDFTRPTWRMIQQFRSNVRRYMRHLPPDSGHMASDLRKLEQIATKDLQSIMTPTDVQRLHLIDQHFHDLSNQFPASQARAIASAPNASKAMAALIRSEPSQVQTLLRGIDHLPAASRQKALTALKKSVGTWIHEEGMSGKTYVEQLQKYDAALNAIPAPAMNRLFGPGSKEAMHEAVDATLQFHRRLLAEPNMIAAIRAEMQAKPLPWIVRHARWVSFGAIYGLAEGDLEKAGLALAVGLTPDAMHVLLNNRAMQSLYVKAVTSKTPAAIAAGFRALLTALASEQLRGPIKDPEESVTTAP